MFYCKAVLCKKKGVVMKNSVIGFPIILLFTGAVISCQSPFFGEQLKSEHIEEEVYVPPQYDKVVPPLSVSATDNVTDKIEISWTKVAAASGYRIYRSEDAATGFEFLAETSETSFSDDGSILPLKSGVSYYYKISSVNPENVESALTEAVAGRCYLRNGEVIPPAVVTASQGSFGDRIVVSWDAVPTAASYRVFRAGSETGPFDGEALIAETGANVYEDNDTNLKPGQNYYYKIQSVGKAAQPEEVPPSSVLSSPVSGYLADPTVPEVTGLSASTADPDKVLLTWNAVDCPVRLFRAEAENGVYEVLADIAAGSEYSDLKSNGNLKEKVYFYKIQAVRSETEKGILSAPVEGHVPIQPPQITLTGGDVIIDINRTRTFIDPGFSAFDNFDGELTSYCIVDESEIDFTKRGEWTVYYSVTDAAGQTDKVERKVKTIFLPNLDNADIVVLSDYAAAGQMFSVEIQGVQPAEVPSELGTSYSYSWSVDSGTVSGDTARVSMLVSVSDSKVQDKKIVVTVSTADGSVSCEKNIPIYPSLTSFGSDFLSAGNIAPYTADIKVLWYNKFSGWVIEEGSDLVSDYDYTYNGGAVWTTEDENLENIIKCSDGLFVVSDTSAYFDWLGAGDAAETAVRLKGPEFGVCAGVRYEIKTRIYRGAGSKADVFVRIGNGTVFSDFAVSTTEGWTDYVFDFVSETDETVSLQVWKMPSGVRQWGDITKGETGNLRTGSDQKEVRIDYITISYKN